MDVVSGDGALDHCICAAAIDLSASSSMGVLEMHAD